MAKGLNKHTPDSEELLKRLNTNDSSGLDDFEKEALEGFDSLDNIEQAKELTNSLNRKIDEKYFRKESGNKKGIMYLSMAAGLLLIVGLSYFFITFLGQNKEMAMSPATKTSEQIANEVAKPVDLAPAEEPKAEGAGETDGKAKEGKKAGAVTVTDGLTESESTVSSGKDISTLDRADKQPDKDDGVKTRLVLKEKKPETTTEPSKIADAEANDYKETDKSKTQGPPVGNVSSPAVVMEDQKNKKEQEEESAEKLSLSKTAPGSSSGKGGKEDSRKSPKKQRAKIKTSGEALGGDDIASTTKSADENLNAQTTVNQKPKAGAPAEPKRDESGLLHNAEFASKFYSKPQDYIKVEIDKSEMLKTNVKAFKAELTIDEKGLVTAVKFLTTFDNCAGCKKELEKILINMPGWKAASKGEKTVIETVSFIYP